MAETWPWLVLAGLGAFHGLNPAMGWLFAVALGLHRGEARIVPLALVPIALGHAASVLIVAMVFVLVGQWLATTLLLKVAGLSLIAWAAFLLLYGHHGRVRFGMKVGLLGLFAWSFLMATAHGAGLMLFPALAPLCAGAQGHAAWALDGPLVMGVAAVSVHTAAMLAVTGMIAIAVYRWIGVGILKSAWINLDAIWIAALVLIGLLLIVA